MKVSGEGRGRGRRAHRGDKKHQPIEAMMGV
jgi:hypothetical protein